MNSIVIRGEGYNVPAIVKTWHESGLEFAGLGKRTETRKVVLHWTGGEGGGPQVHRVLKQRGLSVHFLVDQDGVIWQYADADRRCSHAGTVNASSIGIEIANRANGKPHPKYPRNAYAERVHGHKFMCSEFLPIQVIAVGSLVSALLTAYGLPYEAPSEATSLDPQDLRDFRGVCGHFHVTRRKVDPGARILDQLGLIP